MDFKRILNLKVLLLFLIIVLSKPARGQEFQNLKATTTRPYYDKVKADSITALKFHSSQKAVLIRAQKSYISFNLFNASMNLVDDQKVKKSQKEVYLGEYILGDRVIALTHSFAGRGFSTLYAYTYDVNTKKLDKKELIATPIDKRLGLFSTKKNSEFIIDDAKATFSIVTTFKRKDLIQYSFITFDANSLEKLYSQDLQRQDLRNYVILDVLLNKQGQLEVFGQFTAESLQAKKSDNAFYVATLDVIDENGIVSKEFEIDEPLPNGIQPIATDTSIYMNTFIEAETGGVNQIETSVFDRNSFTRSDQLVYTFDQSVYEAFFGTERGNRKKKKSKGLGEFSINYIIPSGDNGYFVLAELKEIIVTMTGGAVSAGGSTTRTVYSDLLVFYIDNSGVVVWADHVQKDTASYKRAYNAYIKDRQLNILLNGGRNYDTTKNGDPNLKQGFLEGSALYRVVYTLDGTQKVQKIQDNKDDYYLPRYGAYVNGKFIMISDSRSKRRFMFLE
ncbi:hypothetical protein [Gilvibacter sediminis]|uniref:hypothetical protein n=1 Tax=Gilvibacter sediminis TaxID=379071 RepID=UPI0023506480|nr:hypothetical protein [Gilvibacter sediminis]MDC7998840.1 hypothetical protein [Gilvibacter sediminis]